jgi:hypothetical protein
VRDESHGSTGLASSRFAARSKQKGSFMSEEFMRLREQFVSVPAERKELLERLYSAPLPGLCCFRCWRVIALGIPTMSISHSDLMPIRRKRHRRQAA